MHAKTISRLNYHCCNILATNGWWEVLQSSMVADATIPTTIPSFFLYVWNKFMLHASLSIKKNMLEENED